MIPTEFNDYEFDLIERATIRDYEWERFWVAVNAYRVDFSEDQTLHPEAQSREDSALREQLAEANDGTTPETDAAAIWLPNDHGGRARVVPVDVARYLERQRNAWKDRAVLAERQRDAEIAALKRHAEAIAHDYFMSWAGDDAKE